MTQQLALPLQFEADSEPHPSFGGWHMFLQQRTTLRDEVAGVQLYSATNCNFIVFPSGLLIQNYGYHGRAVLARVRENGVAAVEAELREARQQLWEATGRTRVPQARTLSQQRTLDEKTANDVCDWLRRDAAPDDNRPDGQVTIESAVPVRVELPNNLRKAGPLVWYGALLCEKSTCTATERCVTEGPMHRGEFHREYRLLLVGKRYRPPGREGGWLLTYDLPADKRQPLERCYHPTAEWYLSCFWDETRNTAAEHRMHAPFGTMFVLSLQRQMNFGTYAMQAVDHYEPEPYLRLPMTVEYLQPRK